MLLLMGCLRTSTDTLIDLRDGKSYCTVNIGNKTWMAENLNFKTKSSWCYDNNDSNCQKYGRLYNWNTAMWVCPAEWRLPTKDDWNDLIQAAGDSVAGRNLKSKIGWDNDRNGTDEFSFSALPSGYCNSYDNCSHIGSVGFWWSTLDIDPCASYWVMNSSVEYIFENIAGKKNRFPVRCVYSVNDSKGGVSGINTRQTNGMTDTISDEDLIKILLCTQSSGEFNYVSYEEMVRDWKLEKINESSDIKEVTWPFVFVSCPTQTSVTIPRSVDTIGTKAYYRCVGLTSVTIEDGVTAIGEYAFADCRNLASVTIPNSVTAIRNGAFNNCTNLMSIMIPNNVVKIGAAVFAYCTSLVSVTIPSEVTNIEYKSFMGCTGLTSVTIENGVRAIGKYAFADCMNLTTVTIPNSVTEIGDGAFAGSGLISVTIPNNVTYIGREAFSLCKNLMSIIVLNPDPPKVGYDEIYGVNWGGSACLYVPKKSIDAYRSAEMWNRFYYIKPIASSPNEIWLVLSISILIAVILSTTIFVIIKKLRKITLS